VVFLHAALKGRLINPCISNIEDWTCSNNLKLNLSKTVEIIITRQRRKCHAPLIPTLPDVARVHAVQTIKVLGVTISDRLSVNQHVTNVIASTAQTFHALRVLRAHGLNKDALEGVFKAVVIAKLTYACPAWWGFTTTHDRQKMEAVIRRGVHFGFCSTSQAPLAELAAAADETLFEHVLHNKQHVLHQLLPDRTQPTYNLCSRKHDCSLTVKQSVTANEFITRMLYKDMY